MAKADAKVAADYLTNRKIFEELQRRADPEARQLSRGADGEITPNFELVSGRARYVDSPIRPRATPDISPVNENEDVLHNIGPSRHAAHPKTKPLDEDNPTP